jgi:hypothetical protein
MHAPKQQGGTRVTLRAQDSNHRERGRSADAPKSARCLLVYSLAHETNRMSGPILVLGHCEQSEHPSRPVVPSRAIDRAAVHIAAA